MQVILKFNLPFSLNVDGSFSVVTPEEKFTVELTTVENDNPNFPGASHLENVSIVNDATSILSRTYVTAAYNPRDPASVTRD